VLADAHLAPGTFLAIVAASALAGTLAAMAAGRGLVLPGASSMPANAWRSR
jgi:hypothetical protein